MFNIEGIVKGMWRYSLKMVKIKNATKNVATEKGKHANGWAHNKYHGH